MTPTTTERPAELAGLPPEKQRTLDVRAMLRSGGEPFGEIMEAISQVPPGGALRLRTTFKPAPLFAVLRVRGWKHWIEHGEDDDWIVWFYH